MGGLCVSVEVDLTRFTPPPVLAVTLSRGSEAEEEEGTLERRWGDEETGGGALSWRVQRSPAENRAVIWWQSAQRESRKKEKVT